MDEMVVTFDGDTVVLVHGPITLRIGWNALWQRSQAFMGYCSEERAVLHAAWGLISAEYGRRDLARR